MKNEIISVIVPVYNVEHYLEKCLLSILNQTYPHLEIILVNDGSTDSSGKLCDQYAERDARIKVIHKKNGGLSDARNAGMSIATGHYIGFVDSDDWIDEDMYANMVEAAEKFSVEVVICRYKSICPEYMEDSSGNTIVKLSREEALQIYVCEHQQYVIQNSVWCKLFTRRIIGELKFPVGHNSEDIMFTTKILCKMTSCVYLDHAYYNYVIGREGSIMSQKNGSRIICDEIPFLKQQTACLLQAGYEYLADQSAYSFYRRLLFYYVDLKKTKENVKYATEIIKLLRKERREIQRLYNKVSAKTGDRIRMKFVILAPNAYCNIATLYEKKIIPLRNRIHNRK